MRILEVIWARALTVAASLALLACGDRAVGGDLGAGGSDVLLASSTCHTGAPIPPWVRGVFSSADLGDSFIAVSDDGVVYSRDDASQWPRARRLDPGEVDRVRQLTAAATAVDFVGHYQVATMSVGNATRLRLGKRKIAVTGDPGCNDPTAWEGIVPSQVCGLAQHLVMLERGRTPVGPRKVKLQGLALPEYYVHGEPVPPWPLSAIDLASVVADEPLVVEQASVVQQLIALVEGRSADDSHTAPVFEQDGTRVAIDVWPVIDAVNP